MTIQDKIHHLRALEAQFKLAPGDEQVLLRLSETYASLGCFSPKAHEVYRRAIELQPENAATQRAASLCLLLQSINDVLEQKDGAESFDQSTLDHYQQVLEELKAELPASADTLKALGDLYLLRAEYDRALDNYRQLSPLFPESLESFTVTAIYADAQPELPPALTQLIGETLRKAGKTHLALEFVRQACQRLNASQAATTGSNETMEALIALRIALLECDLIPNSTPADAHEHRAELCRIHLTRQDVFEACRIFREMDQTRAIDAELAKQVARLLIDAQDYRGAFECLKRIPIDEEAKQLLHDISLSLEQREELDSAAFILDYVERNDVVLLEAERLKQNQLEKTAQRELAELHFKNGQYNRAVESFLGALELGSEDQEELLELIDASLLRIEQPTAELLTRVADRCLAAEQLMRAVLYYMKALAENPDGTGLHTKLRSCYNRLLQSDPDSPELLVRSAELFLQEGDFDRAIRQLEQAKTNPYREHEAKVLLLNAYRLSGQLHDAYNIASTITLEEEQLEGLYLLQEQLAGRGRLPQAYELAMRIAEVDSRFQDQTTQRTITELIHEYQERLRNVHEGDVLDATPPDNPAGDPKMVELIGDIAIGRYQYMRRIGAGGMGVVHQVYDLKREQMVALKILRESLFSSKKAISRFFREARIVATLHHPNIVNILDYNLHSNPGQSYIAMEYIDGPSMRELIEQRLADGSVLTEEFIAHLFFYIAQLCDALEATSVKGIIHRDIKPDNVLINTQDEVKITDFGIVHIDEVTFTPTGAMIGTPRYMSPEQVKGGHIDGRSDIYGVGIILYEMLLGSPPFISGDIAYQQVSQDPKPPSEITPIIPRQAEKIILKCLAKEPGDRYQHAADLKTDIERAMKDLWPNFQQSKQEDETGTDEIGTLDEITGLDLD